MVKTMKFEQRFAALMLLATCTTLTVAANAKLASDSNQTKATNITIYKDASLISEKISISVNSTTQTHEIDEVPLTLIPYTVMLYLSGHQGEELVQDHFIKKDTQKKSAKLVFTTKSSQPSPAKALMLHYVCTGITWKPFYTLKISPKYDQVTVNGWIIVDNTTNVDFNNAKLLFVDGNAPGINREKSPAHENFKSYPFAGNVNILKNETKKLNWVSYERLSAKPELRINLEKKYLKDMDSKIVNPEVETWLSFSGNDKKSAGNALPQGEAILYYKDEQGCVELLGKTEMNVLEKGKEISIKIPHNHSDKDAKSEKGSSDLIKKISTELDQIEFKKLSDDLTESSYRLTVKNKSDQPVTLKVSVNLPSCKEWVIVRENVAHQELGDDTFYWTLNVDPKKESDLLFRIRIVWLEPISDTAELRKP